MNPLERFSEKPFRAMIEDVGSHDYCLYKKGERLPGDVLKPSLNIDYYNSVLAGTGCSGDSYIITYDNNSPDIVIPKGSPLVVLRLLRYDSGHDNYGPHYNATDQLFFPSKSGDIYRLVRSHPPDHFKTITGSSTLISVADAYNLPVQKRGPVELYSAKGAKLHVDFISIDDV